MFLIQIQINICKKLENNCPLDSNNLLVSMGGNPLNHYGFPTPSVNNDSTNNREYLQYMNYDQSLILTLLLGNEPKLNKEQNKIFDEVINRSMDYFKT